MKNKFFVLLGLSSLLLSGCGTSTTKLTNGGNITIKKDNIYCMPSYSGECINSECTAEGVLTKNFGVRRSYRDTKICFKNPRKPGASNRPKGIAYWGPWPINDDEAICRAARKFNLIPKQTERLDKYKFERKALKEFCESENVRGCRIIGI